MYLKRIAIASLLALAIFGAVYGLAASMTVSGVKNLGSGSATVSAPGSVSAVKWVLDSNDPSKVASVVLTTDFSGTYDVYIKLAGTWYSFTSKTIESGDNTFSLTPEPDASAITSIDIVFNQA
jgi:hypothetical protein